MVQTMNEILGLDSNGILVDLGLGMQPSATIKQWWQTIIKHGE
jgi:hypothetical protein